jgi:endoglucanase
VDKKSKINLVQSSFNYKEQLTMMDMLQVKGRQIVNAQERPVYLRGTCIGGWMNMEEFINGYPGAEHQLRNLMSSELGQVKSDFYFTRLLDHFLGAADLAYIKSLGATVVRLPLNYRHFEDDSRPFEYLEKGFLRLDQIIEQCAKVGLYVILDLHSVQGWQNTDWHCDNASRHVYFWKHPHFQERFYALWKEIARRYHGNPTVAGYNVMNEPVSNAPYGRFRNDYHPDWETINRIYRQVVSSIRSIDPEHIIFLEGDYFSSLFDGLDAPFAPNLVYSSHMYNPSGLGPGAYPGKVGGEYWDKEKQRQVFLSHQGTLFSQKHNVPLWVGEFGSAYNGPAEENPSRVQAMHDQLSVYNEAEVHWTTWTYKDINVMGWVQMRSDSLYLQAIQPAIKAKQDLSTDFWMGWLPPTPAKLKVFELARLVEETLADPTIDPNANQNYMSQQVLSGYIAALIQPLYVRCFKGMSEEKMDDVLASFAFKNCRPYQPLIDVLIQNFK